MKYKNHSSGACRQKLTGSWALPEVILKVWSGVTNININFNKRAENKQTNRWKKMKHNKLTC